MKHIVITILALISFNAHSDDQPTILKTSCDEEFSSGYFEIKYSSENNALITVNSNQIYIDSKFSNVENSDNTYLFTFERTADLGRGGMMLSWDDYSHETPIFKLENIDGYRYKINWFGFWNVKSKNYNWTVSDEFFSGPELNTKESILYNCNFNNSSTTENETD